MTKERMIELLEIEHECMRRGAHNECDRDCARCELVQDDKELDEMYMGAIALLKEQEPKPVELYGKDDWYGLVCICPDCKVEWMSDESDTHFCPNCGRTVKWG